MKLFAFLCGALLFSPFCVLLHAQASPEWTLAANAHFRVYSQAGEEPARNALQWFEQLRAFFQKAGFAPEGRPPVRVIGFRSQRDYDAYRLRPAADAYYVGAEDSDSIVMPSLGADQAGIAAHEYAHLALHANGFAFPPWLNEGLAEYFSTLHIGERGIRLGGDLPMRIQTLQHTPWMPLSQLLIATTQTRAEAGLFYAQSWALTETLILSPEYKGRFPQLLLKLSTGAPGAEALTSVYGKSLEAITHDVRQWVHGGRMPSLVLPLTPADSAPLQVSKLSSFEARRLMAGLLFDIGESNRAEATYQGLLRESPGSADILAALGSVALRRGDREGARRDWLLAMQHGISDPRLCYRYAILADEMGLPSSEVVDALQRAAALQPEFDDARYKLALIYNNHGNYSAALDQLSAMKQVRPARAFAYWSAMAYAHDQLGEREQTKTAATKAMQYAATKAERDRAAQLLYFAETDLTMRAVRDPNGNLQFVTTRVKHGSRHINPFIEPEDRIFRVGGQLIRVDCVDNAMTGVGVQTGKGPITLKIADPQRVLMENAPQEFTCGSQSPISVTVEYAAGKPGEDRDGVLRGMEFEKGSAP